MLIHLPSLLTADTVAILREGLRAAPYTPGDVTAHGLARQVKHNLQITGDTPLGAELGAHVARALNQSAEFREAAIPVRLTPPMFNLYRPGMSYGMHSDSTLMNGMGGVLRADLSMTVFLSHPQDYEGGELAFADPLLGHHQFRLPAGDALLYPTVALHEVRPVIAGERLACVLWVQSAVRDPMQRHALLQLGQVHREVKAGQADAALTTLAQLHQNLLRLWAQP